MFNGFRDIECPSNSYPASSIVINWCRLGALFSLLQNLIINIIRQQQPPGSTGHLIASIYTEYVCFCVPIYTAQMPSMIDERNDGYNKIIAPQLHGRLQNYGVRRRE